MGEKIEDIDVLNGLYSPTSTTAQAVGQVPVGGYPSLSVDDLPDEIQKAARQEEEMMRAGWQNNAGDAPQRTDSMYNLNMQTLDRLTPPMSKEEEDARARKATQAEAWGHIGNGLTALSNLLMRGGAPSMQPQTVPAANVEAWRKGVQGERDAYNKQRAAAAAADEKLYQFDRKQYENQKKADQQYNNRLFLATKQRIGRLNDQWQTQQNALRRLAEQHEYKMTEMEWKQQHPNIKVGSTSRGGKKTSFVDAVSPDGEVRRFYKDRDGETWLGQAEMWTTGDTSIPKRKKGQSQRDVIAANNARNRGSQRSGGSSTRSGGSGNGSGRTSTRGSRSL